MFGHKLYAWFADTAYACTVCGYTTGESRIAFIATTVFLTVLPLAFIAGVVYFLVRKKPNNKKQT